MKKQRAGFKRGKPVILAALCLASAATTILATNFLGEFLLKRANFPLEDMRPLPETYELPTFVSRKSALIYEFVPGFKGNHWGTEFSINSDGFRGKELLPAQRSIRILSLGDSCTFGTGGLADQDTYPAQLEKMLNARFGAGRFEVINAGMPGFSVVYGLILAKEHKLTQLKPALVIICYGWNDHKPAYRADTADARRRSVLNFFTAHSKLFRYFIFRWPPPEQNNRSAKRTLKVGSRQYKDYLAKTVELFSRNNIKVVVMTAPGEPRLFHEGEEWTQKAFDLHPGYMELTKQVGRERKVKLLDLEELFDTRKTADPLAYFNDPFHYNKHGAQLIAEKLSQVIPEMLKVKE